MNPQKLQKISETCDKISTFGFCALIYFIPISNGLLEWSFAFIFLPFVYKRTARFIYLLKEGSDKKNLFRIFIEAYKPVESHLNKVIGFYILIAFISIIFSQHKMVGIRAFFFSLLECTYIYFIFIEVMADKKRLKKFLGVLLVSVTLISINAIFQYFTGEGFIHHRPIKDGRVTSSFKHPNDLGGYFVILLPLVLSLTILFRRVSRKAAEKASNVYLSNWLQLLAAVIFTLALLGLGLTFSRGAWVGFLASIGILGMLRKKKMIVCFLISAAFLGVFYPKIVSTRNVSFISDKAATKYKTIEGDDKNQIDQIKESISRFGGMGRKTYWNQAINVIKARPLFGVGLDAYSIAGPAYNERWDDYYAHNCYLQMAAEIGVFGALVFLFIIGKAANYTIKNLKSLQCDFSFLLTSGIFAGICGFLVHSFFDTNLSSVPLITIFWLCLGCLISIQKNYNDVN